MNSGLLPSALIRLNLKPVFNLIIWLFSYEENGHWKQIWLFFLEYSVWKALLLRTCALV